MGIGFRKRQRAQALQNAAAKGQPAPVFRVPENDEDRYAVTWDRLRNQKVRQRIRKVTQRPPSFSSFLKSTSISLYKARLMLAHSVCFWGDCRERFQTIRQLADHVAASHLKPLFENEVTNIPCGWRKCKMVFKGVRTLLIHMAEMHIGNEDLMNFQVL